MFKIIYLSYVLILYYIKKKFMELIVILTYCQLKDVEPQKFNFLLLLDFMLLK